MVKIETSLNKYVPCLRWKQGEYKALSKLSPASKNILKPLIEVSEIGFDFENQTDSKTIDEHLSKVGARIATNWGYRDCFVDMCLIKPSERMSTGQHPLEYLFSDLRNKGVEAVPVVTLRQDSDCQNALIEIIKRDNRGACVRVNLEELAKSDFNNSIIGLLQNMNIEIKECDFIVDLGAPNFVPVDGFVKLVAILINRLPSLTEWRSFILIGTSFPKSMGEVSPGLSIRPRHEWLFYKQLTRSLKGSNTRMPLFGDYGINHPDVLQLDMRHIKPYASVRYTIDDAYLIAKGTNVRDYGYGQYKGLCKEVVNSKYFYNAKYSAGDKYIIDCAQGFASTGQLTTWRWVGTNHHLEKVANDISSLSV